MSRNHSISVVFRIEFHVVSVHTGEDLVVDLLEELLGKIFELLALREQAREKEPDFLLAELGPELQEVLESKKQS
jgi:hypothetical protein